MSPEEDTSRMSTSFSCPSPSFLPPDSHFIGKKEEIIQARRVTKLVNGCRDVLVLYHQGRLHAMDMRCYHSGGVLEHGDIEEFDGRLCIVCPWHKYKITLAEGEALYQAVDNPGAKPLQTHWRSKGVKQRIHRVTEVSGDVYVTLNSSTEVIESDTYQTEKYRTAFLSPQLQRTMK
ncbi:Rieske domain-containing protein-like isoform X2 [Thalassophryne amazonica]|nr:Rieske domain-containing protein-like isoform X2 [Thalassophryne amazonica]XP_034026281.1 Rieske domain-containing protein-like isoform X2 [Thalassophryne amazonica]XP_034026284.1 Rieske domain-containing protein-like isoform X2 [Thalassophryne amazonica]XP_034026285.1 Rieske domain-containing protein-like isoform X2 [Thalassophryne amazonica]